MSEILALVKHLIRRNNKASNYRDITAPINCFGDADATPIRLDSDPYPKG